jgi:CelD/BcsL family acetyltransferase involved in cellulose biosynthesis
MKCGRNDVAASVLKQVCDYAALAADQSAVTFDRRALSVMLSQHRDLIPLTESVIDELRRTDARY